MVLDKYKAQLQQDRLNLELNEEDYASWNEHKVTKALKIDMEILYIDSVDMQDKCCNNTVDIVADQIINYGKEMEENA